ncbi:MAG: hypothetical protein JRF02_07915 [Deltaproteobacteria bacterium]|jgi:hypothetical protein|nr:hypothetical protein [Deltaproteobacteria bacterium]
MEKMSFQENLWRKIELDRLASLVIASCGTEKSRHPVNKEAMRRLLELSPYQYQHERDLDLYVKALEGELKMILVLDNELPIFRSTIKDVVTRRNPRTLEMWSIRTIRKILVDSDIKMSTRGKSVETVLRDAVEQLDLTYTDADIKNLAREGMAWLAGSVADGVEKTLTMFAALLEYQKPPKYFRLGHMVCYGILASGPDNDVVLGPLVLYRPADNTLVWIHQSLSRSDQQHMKFLRSVATSQASVPVTGGAVFQKLQANVLEKPERVLLV